MKEVSEALGISLSYVGKLEGLGDKPIPSSLWGTVEKFLGITTTLSPEIGRITRDMPVEQDVTIPLYWQSVPAGDLSPIVSDSHDEFNVTKRFANTFAVYIRGESLIDAGIEDSDIAVFRERVEPRDGQVVYACVNNMCTVKVYSHDKAGRVILQPANKKYTPIIVSDGDMLEIQGVLINVVREPKLYRPE